VPECVHGNPGGEVNIAAVLKIPQMAAVRLCKDGGGPAVCCDHVLLMVRNQARRPRVRGGVVGRVGGLMLRLSVIQLATNCNWVGAQHTRISALTALGRLDASLS
jgi:hypothetical protein